MWLAVLLYLLGRLKLWWGLLDFCIVADGVLLSCFSRGGVDGAASGGTPGSGRGPELVQLLCEGLLSAPKVRPSCADGAGLDTITAGALTMGMYLRVHYALFAPIK